MNCLLPIAYCLCTPQKPPIKNLPLRIYETKKHKNHVHVVDQIVAVKLTSTMTSTTTTTLNNAFDSAQWVDALQKLDPKVRYGKGTDDWYSFLLSFSHHFEALAHLPLI